MRLSCAISVARLRSTAARSMAIWLDTENGQEGVRRLILPPRALGRPLCRSVTLLPRRIHGRAPPCRPEPRPQCAQQDPHKFDVGDGEGEAAGDHDAAGEDAIEKADQRYVRMGCAGNEIPGGARRHCKALGPSANE